MAEALDSAYNKITSVDQIPAEQRIYGRKGDIINITRGRLAMMRIMNKHMATRGRKSVDDMEFKYKSDIPRPAILTIAAASEDYQGGTENKIWIAKRHAAGVEVGSVFINRNIFFNGNASPKFSTTRTLGTSLTTFYVEPEAIKVLARLETDSSGNVAFKVQRGYAPSVGSQSGTGALEITTSMKLILLPTPRAVGNNEGKIYGDTPHEETCYTEINLEKWGINRTAQNFKVWQNEGLMERNGRRQVDHFWLKEEHRALRGRGTKGYDEEGELIQSTRGLEPYILTDQPGIDYYAYDGDKTNANKNNHIIDFKAAYGPVGYQSLNKFGNDKFFYGSETKWWICDNIQYTAISNSFDNKVRIEYMKDMSMAYGLEFERLKISGGGTFYLVQSDGFSLEGVQDTGFICDFDYIEPAFLQNEDFTILIDVEKGKNVLKKVNYLYMNSGYMFSNPFAHFEVFNMAS